MNLDELHPILAAYRAKVQPAWSPTTAHPGYDGRAGDPAGQCGVTSAWLQWRLREDHGIVTLYVDGNVYVSTGERSDGRLVDHCWLELFDGEDWLIVDLTADQNPNLKLPPVVCEYSHELYRRGIDYIGDLYQGGRDLPNSLLGRLSVLTGALS